MADISQVTLPDNNIYNIKDTVARHLGVYPVVGTQTAATKDWTGNIDLPALYDGLTIAYYMPYNPPSNNATLDLTLSDGTTTGPVNVYYTGATRATSHYSAGSTILLTYWSAGSVSTGGTPIHENRWTRSDYSSNTIGEYAGACTAGPFGMARYSLILQVDESHWESLVSTSDTGTSKVKNTNGFLLTTILYQNGNTYASGANAGQSSVWYTISGFDTRYSTNGGQFSAAGKPFYIVGTITDDKFYLKDTTWWADELPAQDDGNVYWYVGQFYNSYSCTLSPIHPIYDYIDGEWRVITEYSRNSITVNGHTVEKDVPSDAVFTDTTYTFDTGDSNGQIKVTPSGGTTQNVSVKGLAAGAYASTYAKSDSAGGPATSVKGTAGVANAYRHVWFSDTNTETYRNYDDDFKYNPSTNSVKVSGAYMTYNATTKSLDFTFDE